jgi:hypothetical protein
MASAYREYTLTMSTGDYSTHVAVPLNSLPDSVDECENVLDMYEVRDWADNLIREAELGTFQDAWGWIYENIPNPDDSDDIYGEYYVESKAGRAEYGKLRLVK